jgi:hypothetical protein
MFSDESKKTIQINCVGGRGGGDAVAGEGECFGSTSRRFAALR